MSGEKINFGIHSLTAYDPATQIPFTKGMSKILGTGTLTTTSEAVKLFGGSQNAPFSIENASLDTEFTMALKEYPNWFHEKVLGATVTEVAASPTGSTTSESNVKGETAFDATVGIASAGVKSGADADLKTGLVTVVAVSATTVDVYLLTDLQKDRGSALVFDDANKITASPLTITLATAVEVPGLGIELTGGSGAIAMVTGDSMSFEIVAPHGGYSKIQVGKSSAKIPEIGIYLTGQITSTNQIFTVQMFRVKATSGAPIPFGEKAFGESEVTFSMKRDETRDATHEFTSVIGEA